MKQFRCAVLAAAALAHTPLSQAQTLPAPLHPTLATSSYVAFGMAGIVSGQTARVNALNLAAGGPLVAGGSCQVTVAFLDESGKTLATQTLSAGEGQSVHFDLPGSEAGAVAAAGPVEIRATVSAVFTITSNTATSSPASCVIVPTMEIFNQATGATVTHLETTHALATVVPLTALPD